MSLRSLLFVCCGLNVYRSALIFRNLPCPEKLLVMRPSILHIKLLLYYWAVIGGALLKKVLLKNFGKFAGKHSCLQLYSKKLSGTGVFL